MGLPLAPYPTAQLLDIAVDAILALPPPNPGPDLPPILTQDQVIATLVGSTSFCLVVWQTL